MEIKTKYEIGQRIWIVYKNKGEICMYCEPIIEIVIDKNTFHYCTDNSFDEINEEDIILEDDKDRLFKEIKKLMKEIDEEEVKVKNEEV